MIVVELANTTMASSRCVFCRIVNKEENTEILYEDDTVIAFRDIKPATMHHYLVIPKVHVDNPKTLTSEHRDLIKHLFEIAKLVLRQQECESSEDTTKFGYHWPPFNAINHLHLHAIGNTEQMGFVQKGIFMYNSPWFVSHQWLVKRLESS